MLSGRRILVTGAAGAIGAATAKLLSELDAEVWKSDLVEQAHARWLACDLSQEDEIERLARSITDASGTVLPLWGVVHCAGVLSRESQKDYNSAEWERTLRLNLIASAQLAYRMHERIVPGGRLVLMSSVAAHKGSKGQAAYAASKAGVLGLMRSLSSELAPRVLVNAISPSAVDSPMIAPLLTDHGAGLAAASILGRLGTVEEVAGPVAFLMSDWASYITGQNIHVNGGGFLGP